jgi:long-chain acyl-CoA synthetase
MIFTSGTTSKSKAVMLSQENICANVYDISTVFDINKNDILLSFLPLHHTYEATVTFINSFSVGASIAFCDGLRYIADNLKEYKITVMISVPLLFESMYKKVLKGIEEKGKTKKVKIGKAITKALKAIGIDKRREIFKEIHENFGGELRLCVTGAAALDRETEKGFNELGIELYQGYGLTEASPVVAAEHRGVHKFGSIGQLFPSLEGKVIDKNEMGIGELVIKGPSVMLGYYNNEEATKETFTEDGYLKTGDLGYFDRDGYFFVTGRKKDVIVLKNGKNVYPDEIEILINRIPGVKESFVYGKPNEKDPEDLKIGAKVVYDEEHAEEVFGTTDEKEIKEKIWAQIKQEVNQKMPTYKFIKELTVTKVPLIKTTTSKIKRFEEYKTVVK